MEKEFENIRKKTIKFYTDSGHGYDHTQRVYNLAVRIAKTEKVNTRVVKLAALLHDVARFKEGDHSDPNKVCHAVEGAIMSKAILKKEGYEENLIKHVCECIATHRFSKGMKAKSREGEIIQDADRLDALGAITIGRIFSRGGSRDRPVYDPKILPSKTYPSKTTGKTSMNHFYEKIFKITPESFKTKLAQKIAKDRYQYVKDFVKRFELEWKGKL